MNLDQLRALYDKEQRAEITFPRLRREATPEVVRHIAQPHRESFVLYSRLTAENVDRVIEEQIDRFTTLGQTFEWKVYEHDTPPDLRERLAAHGFEIEDPEAIMVLDAQTTPPPIGLPEHDVRRITDPSDLRDVIAVLDEVWQADHSWIDYHLGDELRTNPQYLSVYVAYADERAVSCAWTMLDHSQFASLWGGATLPAYRGRGIYTTMLAVRIAEARARGKRFFTVDASPMSRPILEKHGFQRISTAYACKWRIKR